MRNISSTERRARRKRASASSARCRSRRYASSAFCCSARVRSCSPRIRSVLSKDPAERRTRTSDAGADERRVPPGQFAESFGRGRPPRQDRPVVEEALQVVGQFPGRGIALRRLLAERLQHDRFQLTRHGGMKRARRSRLVVGDLPQQFVAVASLEDGPQRQQLIEGGPQRVNVAAVVHHAVPRQDLLGAGVAERAEQFAGHGEPGVAGHLCQTEVGDPELPRAGRAAGWPA